MVNHLPVLMFPYLSATMQFWGCMYTIWTKASGHLIYSYFSESKDKYRYIKTKQELQTNCLYCPVEALYTIGHLFYWQYLSTGTRQAVFIRQAVALEHLSAGSAN